jgi:competence protein ComEA
MKKTGSQASARWHERLFLLCAAAAAVVCILLAAALAPPRLTPKAASETPMVQLIRVDLNTADLETLCILPNVGEKRAQAILEYRGHARPVPACCGCGRGARPQREHRGFLGRTGLCELNKPRKGE